MIGSSSLGAQNRLAVHVTADAERQIRQGHPWIYNRAIRRQNHPGCPGDLAVVFDRNKRFLAIGLYDPTSPIRVRILHRGRPTPIDRDWFQRQLACALKLRKPLLSAQTTACRLVYGENDGFPGLVIDRYGGLCVIKLYTVAWIAHLQDVLDALRRVLPVAHIVLRLSRQVREHTTFLRGMKDGMMLVGSIGESPVTIHENGLAFEVDPVRGQKTGFFLDQRDNRLRVEQLSAGRTVLDTFAYTGGFSVYAARGRATEVTSVDFSAPVLKAAARNMACNTRWPGVAKAMHRTVKGDVFELLKKYRKSRRNFGMVILDPPAFAKKKTDVGKALSAHGSLTTLALSVLKPGGVLVSACCSGQVSAKQFFQVSHQAAKTARRHLRILERTEHALDHPVCFSEGAYLKCVFAVVS